MFQVHIQPITGPILGHTGQQKSLVVVPSSDIAVQKVGADNQVLKLSYLRFIIVSYNSGDKLYSLPFIGKVKS
jgi:hypothetical protein